jgi:hypothetical protein
MGVPGKVTLGDERRRRNREVFLISFRFFLFARGSPVKL